MSDENVAVNYTDSKRGVSAITCITVATFSLASWIAINGIWVELPNFIYELPEGFKLPSYLTVICQVGNIGCITYFLSKKYCPIGDKRKVEHFAIIAMLCAGYIACVLLGFLWNKTTMIGNKETSFAFLFLVFIVSLVDCTSSVTFLPFMAILPRSYISPFFIGETLSSFVPSIIALIQGPYVLNNKTTSNETSTRTNKNGLLFSQGWFFASLAFLMVASLLAYVALNYVPFFKRQHVKQLSSDGNFDSDTEELISEKDVPMRRDNRTLPYLLILLLLLSFQQNGLVPSISSYAFAPYGTVPYHLGNILDLAMALYFFVNTKSFETFLEIFLFAFWLVQCYSNIMTVNETFLLYSFQLQHLAQSQLHALV